MGTIHDFPSVYVCITVSVVPAATYCVPARRDMYHNLYRNPDTGTPNTRYLVQPCCGVIWCHLPCTLDFDSKNKNRISFSFVATSTSSPLIFFALDCVSTRGFKRKTYVRILPVCSCPFKCCNLKCPLCFYLLFPPAPLLLHSCLCFLACTSFS